MKTAEVTLISQEEQKLDPAGRYAGSDRAELIEKIIAVEEAMIAAANSQFHNAVAQLRILNPNVDFVVDGLDEDKKVPTD
ncbi:hypothetical protein A2U01_0083659, partial [Trifolium medium]|nr:hypothetical protein [Trifolium medium]